MLLKHLFKIYRGVLLASTEQDYEFLSEYCEESFLHSIKDKLDYYKAMGYRIELVEDMKGENNTRIYPEMHLYDCIIIKGLSIDRKKNMEESKYSVCNDIEDMGFISYIPQYLSDPMNFKNKETAEEKLKIEFKNVKNFFIYFVRLFLEHMLCLKLDTNYLYMINLAKKFLIMIIIIILIMFAFLKHQ